MQRRVVLFAAAIVAVVVLGVLYWTVWRDGEPAEPGPETATTTEAPEPEAPARPTPAALPSLDSSDALVRDLLGDISSHPGLAPFLANEQLVRTFVAVVTNIANGTDPRRHLAFLAPEETFEVIEREGQVFIDPASFERYDRIADTFASIDVVGTVRVYRRLEPLLDAAYRDLGYPEGRFADALAEAMGRLLGTPVPGADIALRPRTRRYDFADPALEALSAPQKQLIRMGPRNARSIQTKLRELRAMLISAGIFDQS